MTRREYRFSNGPGRPISLYALVCIGLVRRPDGTLYPRDQWQADAEQRQADAQDERATTDDARYGGCK